MIVAAGVGSGATAAAAVAGGADLVAYYNTAAYRVRGLPTALSFLPYDNCNDLAHIVSGEVVSAVAGRVTVLAGVGAHDPRVPLGRLLDQAAADGADGVMNEPFITIYGPEVRDPLEEAGLGFEREVELLQLAVERGMTTLGWAFDGNQASRLAGAGVTYVGAMGGMMRSGAQSDQAVTAAIDQLEGIAQQARAVNPACLVLGHGGPFSSVESVAHLLAHSSLDGFMTGSNGERVPLHTGIRDTITQFKAIETSRGKEQADGDSRPC